jgi:hypothetical protein
VALASADVDILDVPINCRDHFSFGDIAGMGRPASVGGLLQARKELSSLMLLNALAVFTLTMSPLFST